MIFLDWALEGSKTDLTEDINILLEEYQENFSNHPMTSVLRSGLLKSKKTGRRGDRSARKSVT